ncbi:MAG: 3-oxoacyl-ACP synthase [Proteobacteria bacterium]|mgnify:CR=1 FL=1|nr:3-oxoacyl-ACP synthase [Pseudomonadota bacterium]
MYSRIISTGSYLPEKRLTNFDFEQMLETSNSWIVERSGIESRRVAGDNELASDLGYKAAYSALKRANLEPNDVDLIIVATTTPDMIFPSTACIVQSKLGVKDCIAFDVQAVCSGFVYGLNIADLFIKSGQAKTALVIGSEVYSRILDYNDRGTCVLFGDGAGAAIIANSKKAGLMAAKLHANGDYKDKLCVPGSISKGKVSGNPFVHMDGPAVFKFAVKAFEEVSLEVMHKANIKISEIDWFIPHQANTRIMKSTAQKLGLDEKKLVSTVHHHGNTSAASIPLALNEFVEDGKIKSGDTVLLAGVGGGFTWGGILLKY